MSIVDITAGDDLDIVYTIKDQDGAIVDLTGGSISWKVIETGDPTNVIFEKTGVLTTPASGITTVTIDAADTAEYTGIYELLGVHTTAGSLTYTFETSPLRLT